jgi:hypothetical protein
MPIKQPGEIGPKPIMANREKTAKDFSCAEFIVFKGDNCASEMRIFVWWWRYSNAIYKKPKNWLKICEAKHEN